MEPEWISKNEYMRRNHIGQNTMLKMMHEGKVEYQKIGTQYKIKVSKNETINKANETLIRENEELKSTIRAMLSIGNQVKV